MLATAKRAITKYDATRKEWFFREKTPQPLGLGDSYTVHHSYSAESAIQLAASLWVANAAFISESHLF